MSVFWFVKCQEVSRYQHARFKRIRTNRDVPEVYIRIGPQGSGKSSGLDEQYRLDKWIEAPDNTDKWFDGFELAHDLYVFLMQLELYAAFLL